MGSLRARRLAGALVVLGAIGALTSGAAAQQPADERAAFWSNLQALCGSAYEGAVIHAPAADTAFTGRRLVMHVAHCDHDVVRIPFHAGDDRSRTWVLRRAGDGLELKHIHRHEDGTESSNTNYGGTTAWRGSPHRQEFPADAVSIAAVAARASQWWFVELYPGQRFAYGLFRQDGGMHYRIEFDLTTPVPAPPPPW
jgi:hypothetical protein